MDEVEQQDYEDLMCDLLIKVYYEYAHRQYGHLNRNEAVDTIEEILLTRRLAEEDKEEVIALWKNKVLQLNVPEYIRFKCWLKYTI